MNLRDNFILRVRSMPAQAQVRLLNIENDTELDALKKRAQELLCFDVAKVVDDLLKKRRNLVAGIKPMTLVRETRFRIGKGDASAPCDFVTFNCSRRRHKEKLSAYLNRVRRGREFKNPSRSFRGPMVLVSQAIERTQADTKVPL